LKNIKYPCLQSNNPNISSVLLNLAKKRKNE